MLRSWLLQLHFLDEQVEHLRLEELLDKVARGLGLDGLVEAPLLEDPRLVAAVARHIVGVMADGLDEERHEGFGDHPVEFLHS